MSLLGGDRLGEKRLPYHFAGQALDAVRLDGVVDHGDDIKCLRHTHCGYDIPWGLEPMIGNQCFIELPCGGVLISRNRHTVGLKVALELLKPAERTTRSRQPVV